MNRSAAAILEQEGSYAHLLERVSGAFGEDVSSATPIRLSSDRELVDGIAVAARLVRLAEGELVRLAGEVQRRSPAGDDASLAKRMGERSPATLVARHAVLPSAEAAQLVLLGEDVRPREALSGEPLPADRPHLAAAVADGRLPLTVASAIRRCLDKVAAKLSRQKLDELEARLASVLEEGWTVDDTLAWLQRVPEMVDPDGSKPREDAVGELAKVTKITLESGITRYMLDLDPVTAGAFETAMDAGASLKRPGGMFDAEAEDGAVSEADAAAEQADRRPLQQRRVDGIRLMAMRALKMDDGQTGGTAVTMVVTITEEALRTGIGSAAIDGIDTPISAATARVLAAGADFIPVVLGGASQVLDYGDARRTFSQGQRRAMGARDRGCVGPGCRAPLSACEGAHLRPHGYGPTSVDNGVMLCWHCHRLLDLHGWQIRREHDRWWWFPPPWVDPYNRRRPGGTIPPPDLTPGPFGN